MKRLFNLIVLTSLGAIPLIASGQITEDEVKRLTVEQLKVVYLACDRRAMSGELSSGAIAQCSIVYETLKQRAFGGDFDKLLAWSRSQPRAEQVAR